MSVGDESFGRRAARVSRSAVFDALGARPAGRSLRRPRLARTDRFGDLAEVRTVLEELLLEGLVPFWTSDELVDPAGGYRLHHGPDGRWLGPAPHTLVSQARLTWFLSRLASSRYGGDRELDLARHGFEHLRGPLWDGEHGGFHWEIDAASHAPLESQKQVYGEAFGLYAVSEFALASDDSVAAELARELVGVLDAGHDPEAGGYVEFLAADRSAPGPGDRSPRWGYPSHLRSRDTQLHVLEALLVADLVVDDADPRVRDRLRELVTVLSVTTMGPDWAGREWFDARWRPVLEGELGRVSYGHDLEGVWLVDRANRRLGVPRPMYADEQARVVEQALRWGMHRRRGDIAEFGVPGTRPARWHRKDWVQAEAMIALLSSAFLDDDDWYLDAFRLVLTWVVDHQVDREHGDWHRRILPNGQCAGLKAGPWQGPYHTGRCLLECIDLIDTHA